MYYGLQSSKNRFAPENSVSGDGFGCTRPALARPFFTSSLNLVLACRLLSYFILYNGVYLHGQPPSDQPDCTEAGLDPDTTNIRAFSFHFILQRWYCGRMGINRVRLPNLMNISLSPFAPEKLVSRDGFGSPVPRQPANLHTPAESGAYLRDSSQVPRRRTFIYLNRQTPSGQSRVYWIPQLRTDGVHCRESAGTGPVNLKVVPNECCLGRSPRTN